LRDANEAPRAVRGDDLEYCFAQWWNRIRHDASESGNCSMGLQARGGNESNLEILLALRLADSCYVLAFPKGTAGGADQCAPEGTLQIFRLLTLSKGGVCLPRPARSRTFGLTRTAAPPGDPHSSRGAPASSKPAAQ
jgi:hypothetical protein